MSLEGKKIVLGICGGIAAYKSASLLRLLIKKRADVQVVMTPAAKEFITPLTLATLSRKPVVSEFFDRRDGTWNSHVDLGVWADLMLIAPATASSLGKMAHGIADNMLITTYLSMKAPVMVVPSMDLDMYAHISTQDNLHRLRDSGVMVMEPESGFLASGLEGKGRMPEPENIIAEVETFFVSKEEESGVWKNRKVLVTAGPTYEMMDDVRFLGNHSSGFMGICIANSFAYRGAEVHLCLGPTHLKPSSSVIIHPVVSAVEMMETSQTLFSECDVAIFAAAVADFRPTQCVKGKTKRSQSGNTITLELVQNPDIAATLGAQKTDNQYLVGFALETSPNIEEARRKLRDKHLDAIVLNSLSDQGAGFGVPTNKVTIIDSSRETAFPLETKQRVAENIVAYVSKHLSN